MKKISKNKEVTINDLAIMVAKGFENTATKDEIKSVKDEIKSVVKRLDGIDYRLGKIESNHERRIDLLEDKMQVVKTYFDGSKASVFREVF